MKCSLCKKSNQRWLWHAIDHETHEVLAYHFGTRKDVAFKTLQEKLSCFEI
jgi:insertion element IS1 protein InsB